MLDRLHGPGAWDNSAKFGSIRPLTAEWGNYSAIGPLHWAAVYGHYTTFVLLMAWFKDHSPGTLLEIFDCTCYLSLANCAVLHLFHPQRQINNSIKIINTVVGLLPEKLSFDRISPLFLATGSRFVTGDLIEALLSVPGGLAAYGNGWKSHSAGFLQPVSLGLLLDAGVKVDLNLLTQMALRIIFRTTNDTAQLVSFHATLQRASQSVKDSLFSSILHLLVSDSFCHPSATQPIATTFDVMKDNACPFDRRFSDPQRTSSQHLVFEIGVDDTRMTYLISETLAWIIQHMGLDMESVAPHHTLGDLKMTVRERAVFTGSSHLASLVLAIPYVPLVDEPPLAVFALCTPSCHDGTFDAAGFLQYPSDILSICRWAALNAEILSDDGFWTLFFRLGEVIHMISGQGASEIAKMELVEVELMDWYWENCETMDDRMENAMVVVFAAFESN